MTSHDQRRRLFENQNRTSEYTLRKMYEFYEGQVYKMFSRLPLYKTQLTPKQIMRNKTIMESMTDRELDGLNPEDMSMVRRMEIARKSRQDVKQVSKMLEEFLRIKKVWRKVQKLMSDTKAMDMSSLFWNEILTPFNIEFVPEAEITPPPPPPRKLPPPKNQNPTSDEYTLRKMYGLYEGQVYKMFSRLPLYKTQLNPEQILRYKTILESMSYRELDGQNPEHMIDARMCYIARESRQDVKQVRKVLKEFMRLKKVWRDVERLMSDTKLIDMSALFWNEIASPFNKEIVPEAENIVSVKWTLIYLGTFLICFWLAFP